MEKIHTHDSTLVGKKQSKNGSDQNANTLKLEHLFKMNILRVNKRDKKTPLKLNGWSPKIDWSSPKIGFKTRWIPKTALLSLLPSQKIKASPKKSSPNFSSGKIASSGFPHPPPWQLWQLQKCGSKFPGSKFSMETQSDGPWKVVPTPF